MSVDDMIALEKFRGVLQRLTMTMEPNLEIMKEFRLILIEADQMEAALKLSDVLVHMEAARELLNQIVIE